MAATYTGDGVVTATIANLGAAALTFFDYRKGYEGNLPAFAVLAICRSDYSNRTNDLYVDAKRSPKREVPDYAVDMHTGRGKRMGRNLGFFIEEGQRVDREAFPSKYVFYDPVHGTSKTAADNVTKFPDPYVVSDHGETGGRRSSMLNDPDEDDAPAQENLF